MVVLPCDANKTRCPTGLPSSQVIAIIGTQISSLDNADQESFGVLASVLSVKVLFFPFRGLPGVQSAPLEDWVMGIMRDGLHFQFVDCRCHSVTILIEIEIEIHFQNGTDLKCFPPWW
jgi:hypothetical protein